MFHYALFLWPAGLNEERNEFARRIVMEDKAYRSPVRKLMQFFERSRDGWKRKRQEAKVVTRRLSNRVRKLEASRDLWKQRAKQQQQELRRFREELEESKKAVA
jgi:hypothetical protein